MRSLRLQLLLGLTIGTLSVLLLCCVVLYALIERLLRAEFDEALATKARSLAALVELDEDGLESELATAVLPQFATTERAAYYELWLPDESVLARSQSLANGDLPRLAGPVWAPEFSTLQLPSGRPGRAVGIEFAPRTDQEEVPADTGWTVTLVVAAETSGLQATLLRVRGMLIGVGLLAIGLSAAVVSWVVHRNLRPVDRLSGEIAGVAAADLSVRIEACGIPRELVPVVDRLNDLLARLEAAFARERRFTGDVAHELRTPLAGMGAKLELALARDRPPETYRGAMNDALAINLQMQRIVENLLHLARADAGQLQFRREPVDVVALLRECWEPLEARARARGLELEWRLNVSRAASADRDALRRIFQNLFDNAVVYAEPASRIGVSAVNEGHVLLLSVANRTQLPPDDVSHVFERFWRADPARQHQDETRCGLGLSLCRALVEQLGGSITAVVRSRVFTVTVRLPLHQDATAVNSTIR